MNALNPCVSAGKLKPFSGDTELVPGIRAVASPGHTVGHTVYLVESMGEVLVLWGDLMHVAAEQFPDPSATIRSDTDSAMAAVQRKKVFADAAEHRYWVAGDHLSFPGIGHLRASDSGYTFVPANCSALHLTPDRAGRATRLPRVSSPRAGRPPLGMAQVEAALPCETVAVESRTWVHLAPFGTGSRHRLDRPPGARSARFGRQTSLTPRTLPFGGRGASGRRATRPDVIDGLKADDPQGAGRRARPIVALDEGPRPSEYSNEGSSVPKGMTTVRRHKIFCGVCGCEVTRAEMTRLPSATSAFDWQQENPGVLWTCRTCADAERFPVGLAQDEWHRLTARRGLGSRRP